MQLPGLDGVETYKNELAKTNTEDKKEYLLHGEEKVEKIQSESNFNCEYKCEFKCEACYKLFTTKASLKRHDERSPVCVNWKTNNLLNKNKFPQVPLHDFLDTLLEGNYSKETDGSIKCKYCNKIFSNKGNYNKHFSNSLACQNMTYDTFKTEIKEKLFSS